MPKTLTKIVSSNPHFIGFLQAPKGKGVAQNNILAVKWLLLAADQRDPDAQRVLGNCTSKVRALRGTTCVPSRGINWLQCPAMQMRRSR
jgi:hypothetical protein